MILWIDSINLSARQQLPARDSHASTKIAPLVSLHPPRDHLQAKDRQDGLQSLPSSVAASFRHFPVFPSQPRREPFRRHGSTGCRDHHLHARELDDLRVQGNRDGHCDAFPHPGAAMPDGWVPTRTSAAATTARRSRAAASQPPRCWVTAPHGGGAAGGEGSGLPILSSGA